MVIVQINSKISPLIDAEFITHIASETLAILALENSEISIVLENNEQIRKLNKDYRGLDEPTDVLSFSFNELDPDTGSNYLGDVIISTQKVKKQALDQGHSIKKELVTLIIHGILHLAGYDHSTEKEEKEFFDLQNEILEKHSADWTVIKSDKIVDSFGNAAKGFLAALKSERNLWIHITISVLVILLGIILKLSNVEWSLLILVISIVLMAEFFNTALEYLVNFSSPEKNESARMVKDVSAAAVLVVSISALIIGGIIFLPKLINLLK
jgi:probable rRNA maturation factor